MKDKDIMTDETDLVTVPAELQREEAPAGLLDLINIKELDITEFEKVATDLIEKVKRFNNYALRVTNERDWVDQGGQPFLRASGAEKIRKLFGINVKIDPERIFKETREDKIGKFYIYTVHGFAWKGSVGMSAIGTCSSRDKFFGYANRKWKPLEEVSETNIKKKAISNFEGNAIKRYLGLRNISWKEVEAAGLNRKEMVKVTYRGQKDEDEGDSSEEKTKKEKKIAAIKAIIDKTTIPKRAKDGMKNLLPTLNEKGLDATMRKANKYLKMDKETIDKLYKLPKKFRDTLLKNEDFMNENKEARLKDIKITFDALPKESFEEKDK